MARTIELDGVDVPAPVTPERRARTEALILLEPARLALNGWRLVARRSPVSRTVMVLPGRGGNDVATAPLRAYLRSLGHEVHGWGLGTHRGEVLHNVTLLKRRLAALHESHDQPVALVGWSLGGIVAREVARQEADRVSHVITMGAPVVGGAKYTALAATYRARGLDLDEVERELARVPVSPTTSPSRRSSAGSTAWCRGRRASTEPTRRPRTSRSSPPTSASPTTTRCGAPSPTGWPARTRSTHGVPTMHDDHVLVEARIRRELIERVMPAMYSATMPLVVAAWDVPGEPVSFDEAMAGDVPTVRRRRTVEPAVGHDVVPLLGRRAAGVAGPQLEAVIDLGFHPDSAGFQSEGLVWIDGQPRAGHPPAANRPAVAGRRRRARSRSVVEAASNPAFPSLPAVAARLAGHRRREPAVPAAAGIDSALRDDDVFGLLLDVEVLLGLATVTAADDAAAPFV